jgi:hypothetical protein
MTIVTRTITRDFVAVGASDSGLIGSITDSVTTDLASDFTVSINWGDNTTTMYGHRCRFERYL